MAEFKLDRFKYNWRGEWTPGTEYLRDDIVRVNGKSYVCVVTHTATALFRDDLNAVLPGSNPPQPQPKWVVMTDGRQFVGNYTPGEVYNLGDIVKNDGVLWLCIESHTSTGDPSESTYWEVLVQSMAFIGSWQQNTVYGTGAIITYGGNAYKATTAHLSTDALENDISNWEDFYVGYVYRGEWQSGEQYIENDLVQYGSTIFKCTESHSADTPDLDITKFILEIPGTQKEPLDWSSETYYNQGDIVRYGGYLYFAIENSFDVDPSRSADDSTVSWVLLAKTTTFEGEWAPNRIYKTGNVVLRGGYLYVALRDVNLVTGDDSSQDYLDPDIWELQAPGQIWDNSWDVENYYSVGDVVYHLGTAYVCNFEHESTSFNRPGDNGEIYDYWDILIQAGRDGGLHDRGDLLTYGLTRGFTGDDSTEGDVRVPIGENDQLLSINSEQEVFWRNIVADAEVVYVASHGVDAPGYGFTHQKPFKTIRYACEYIQDNLDPLTPAKVSVATGRYEEIGPIIVPAGCVVMGDELRATTIVANSPIEDYENDFEILLQYKDHIRTFIVDLITNVAISPTTGNTYPQTLLGVVGESSAAQTIVDLIDVYTSDVEFRIGSAGDDTETTGSNTPNTAGFVAAANQILANLDFIANEIVAWRTENIADTFDSTRVISDVRTMMRGIALDVKVQDSNFNTKYAARRYANAVNGSAGDNIFYMRDTTGLRNCSVDGLQGALNPPGVFELYQRPTGGACVSLDPGWGPDDETVWIKNRSPYIQGVTNIGYGCVGCKIDGSLHNGGNKSMVTNDFTQVLSDGIGCWVLNGARAELVSMFTYYCAVGYLAEGGGIIRSAQGNNSYGIFGSVSDGNDASEVPQSCTVDNRNNEAQVERAFAGGDTDQLFLFEYTNTGTEYTTADANIRGAGALADVEFTDFRTGGLMTARLINTQGSGSEGGSQYLIRQGQAQVTADSTTSIILSATDVTQNLSEIEGMRIIIVSGDGVGQYGIVNSFDTVSKTVGVIKESDGNPGWDHVVAGWPIETALDSTAQYRIEPRVVCSAPGVSSGTGDLPSLNNLNDAVWGYTTQLYNNLSGQAGTGETFETDPIVSTWRVNREGPIYTVTNINPGAGYAIGDTITIAGTSLGGASPANDLVITVTSTSEDSTNSIQSFTSEGTPVGKTFVVLTQAETALYSDDLSDWSTASLQSLSGNSYIKAIAANNRFLIIANGGNNYQFSYTADDWNTRSLPITANWVDIAYGNGKYVMLSDSQDYVYSTDGLTFTAATMPSDTEWHKITYGQGVFVAVTRGNAADTRTAISTDGINWTDGGALPATSVWTDLVYGNNRFLLIDPDGTSYYSVDHGTTWRTGGTISAIPTIINVKYANGLFVAVGHDGTNTSIVMTSEDGLIWNQITLSNSQKWSALTFSILNDSPVWAIFADQASVNAIAKLTTGARAKVRSDVFQGSFQNLIIWDPGSGYVDGDELNPVVFEVTDTNFVTEVEFEPKIRNGVLSQPDFINRGAGYRTSSSTIEITGDGFADIVPEANTVTIVGVSVVPGPGVQIRFASIGDDTTVDPDDLKLFTGVGVEDLGDDGSGEGTRRVKFTVSPRLRNEYNLEHDTVVTLRSLYSQCRISGHDFLDIGTGNFVNTNYPDIYAEGNYFVAAPENEVLEQNGGRVFYTSTDQDGNFRAGELFAVSQATGIVTISAEFFDLDGLSELALGGVRLGGSGTVVREFSTDATFSEDSNNVVPTQRAIATFLEERLSVGGENLELNGVIAGSVQLGTSDNILKNVAGGGNAVNFPGTVIFGGNYDITDVVGTVVDTRETGIQGSYIAMQMFLNDPFDPGMQ